MTHLQYDEYEHFPIGGSDFALGPGEWEYITVPFADDHLSFIERCKENDRLKADIEELNKKWRYFAYNLRDEFGCLDIDDITSYDITAEQVVKNAIERLKFYDDEESEADIEELKNFSPEIITELQEIIDEAIEIKKQIDKLDEQMLCYEHVYDLENNDTQES
jgi:hypothetical protein